MTAARALAAGACLAAATSAACARAMFVPPTGPGTPVPEAASAWAEATAACRTARTYAGALRLSGRAGGQRLWPVSVQSAATSDGAVYLSATVAGRSLFVLAGHAAQATLWLREDSRVVTARPAEIVEAMVGVSIEPTRWLAVLSGCVARDFAVDQASRHGKFVSIRTPDARVFLSRRGSVWRVAAAEADGFLVEYGWSASSFPSDVWMWTAPDRTPKASLHLSVSDAAVNTDVPPGVFVLPAAAKTAEPMSLDQLRAAGPLRDRGE